MRCYAHYMMRAVSLSVKSKGDRLCKIGQKENVCLFCSYVFSVRNGQADRGKKAPSISDDCRRTWPPLRRNG